jgi:hypothetical protein
VPPQHHLRLDTTRPPEVVAEEVMTQLSPANEALSLSSLPPAQRIDKGCGSHARAH